MTRQLEGDCIMKSAKWIGMLALLVTLTAPAAAQDAYPARPVQLIYPFGSGGTDTLFRVFAQAMGKIAGVQFVYMNREGASGAIGAASVARAQPDGYTLMIGPSIVMTNLPYTQKDLPYGFDSFDFVCQLNVNAFVLAVRADAPYKRLEDLIEAARKKPGKFNYGHSGTYTDVHLNMLTMAREAGIEVQDIAYRGDGPNLLRLLAGDLEFTINSVVSVASRNDVRPLAVFWDRRHPALPDVPTVRELGYSSFFTGYQGVYAPKGTPKPVIAKLEDMCVKAVETEEYQTTARNQGAAVVPMKSASFASEARANYEAKGKLFAELGVQPQ
ncbi:MAG: tripartite tricarboxylate transporter substrate binding protein [Pigmentiphaga sp.]|uniref:Bug family tripartite tricarboxylate transporter substrate binding protein n=1 Tax=Pigmentiphaga sp. TaxID=1977564 RepID=UPI0029B3725A|nr:tripartite tricarboxylate transporter substrate binding protein [Pigmentiphaga sp.]MDX3904636.1 tripartite tricarboxylate transporter substrate binding protein [Pigmentiphaga sp.]